MKHDDKKLTITMSRLKGEQLNTLSVQQIPILKELIAKMLHSGVARHALPIRDLIAPDEQSLSMVDFERVTFRTFFT